MEVREGRVGEGQRWSHGTVRRGRSVQGAVPRVGPSPRDEAAGGLWGCCWEKLHVEGVEESEDKWTWHLCVCLSRHFIPTAFREKWPPPHTVFRALTSSSVSIPSSTSGSQRRGAGRGASTLAEFAKGQTTTLEGKGWRRCAEQRHKHGRSSVQTPEVLRCVWSRLSWEAVEREISKPPLSRS